MSRRPFGPTVGAVDVDRRRRVRPGPGTVVARIDPEPAGPGPAASGIEHGKGGVVGEQLGRGEDMGGKAVVQRLEPPAGTADPAGQGRAFDAGAVPREDLCLAIKRQVVGVLADQHVGDESPRSPDPWRSAARARAPDGSCHRRGSRTWARRIRMTRSWAGTQSSISLVVSPIGWSWPPQPGHAPAVRRIEEPSMRGRWSGKRCAPRHRCVIEFGCWRTE